MTNPFDIIQASDHKIQACGPSTGHFVKTVAMCENASIADHLLRGVSALDVLPAKKAEIEQLRAEISQCALELEEAGKLLARIYPASASIMIDASIRARAALNGGSDAP
jgi:uncharacterized protein YhaN